MEKFPLLQNELARLEKLYSYDILDMEPDDRFDDLTKLTASILDLPVCLITLMDADWQVFISNVGTDLKGNHRELAFCRFCVVQEHIIEVEDATKDDRFMDNPFVVTAPNLRYYIGAPLVDEEGFIIGTVCGYDLKPRRMSEFQRTALNQIASTVMHLIQLRKVDMDQKKYKGIVNLSQDILCILSKDGYLKEFNPALCEMLKVQRHELLSALFSKWVNPEDLEKYNELINNSAQTEIKTGVRFRLLNSNRESITVEWSYYFDPEFSITVISGHDITQSILRQSQLEAAVNTAEEAIKMKDQFLSDMSHEIRTPLASIVGFNQLLKSSRLTTEQKTYIDAVSSASEHLMNIVNEVLDVYKLDNYEASINPCPESLSEILRKIETLFMLKAQAKNIRLIVTCDERIPNKLNIDRTRLFQILSNLTSNALKFTNEGSVTVSALLTSLNEHTASILFSVKDTGVGIAPSRQAAIFERFIQENDATWKQYGGTGLGLSIAKQLVDLHGAKLQLTSELNKGTTVSFEANFTVQNLSSVISESHAYSSNEPEIPSLHGLRILVAEDNKHLQILCKTFINRNGGETHIVSDGREAIEYLSSNEIDAVIVDMQMPELTGVEVARYIKNELNLNCPIIGCSANLLDVEHSADDMNYLDEFITKPYTEYRLISVILQQFESKTLNYSKDHFQQILSDLRRKEGDQLVDEFKRIFTTRIPDDINDLIDARKNRDFPALKRKAHFLSTTLLTLQFTYGRTIASDLEKEIEKGQETSSLMLCDQLIDYLNGALKELA